MKFWLLRMALPCVMLLVLGNLLLRDLTNHAQVEQNQDAVPIIAAVDHRDSGNPVLKTSKPEAAASKVSDIAEAPATCAADSVMQQQLGHILKQRKQYSSQLIQQLLASGTKTIDIAAIIHQLGGDMLLLAQNRPDYPANPNTLIRFEHQPRAIPRTLALMVLQASLSQNYQPLLTALQADAAPHQLSWHGQTLLTAIMATDPNLSLFTLQQLIDAGLQPVFADLVAATALQLPVPLVDTLNMAFTGDRQQLWFHQYRRNNLTLQAAADGHVALYDYWLAQGVPALISAADLNAFDLLPFPTTQSELATRLPLIRNFVKQGLLPRQFTSLTSWLLLLPTDEALQLSQQLAGTKQKISAEVTTEMDIQKFADAMTEINQEFKQHIAARHQCGQLFQLGSLLLLPDEVNLNYGAALKAGFRVDQTQIEAAIQLYTTQQQLELLLESQQWQQFIRQAQQQLVSLAPQQRSDYVLQQLLQYQAPAELLIFQLQRYHRRHGLPAAELLAAIQQSQDPKLQTQLHRLRWWPHAQKPAPVPVEQ